MFPAKQRQVDIIKPNGYKRKTSNNKWATPDIVYIRRILLYTRAIPVGFLQVEGQCLPRKDPTFPQGLIRHRLKVDKIGILLVNDNCAHITNTF